MLKRILLTLMLIITAISPVSASENYAEKFLIHGLEYMMGDGKPQDKKKAFELFMGAAMLGNPIGQYLTGLAYERGDGVEKDNLEAEKWVLKAAGQGHTEAQSHAGLAYYTGKWGKRDYAKAVSFYKAAAVGGDQFSMYSLGYLYDAGLGVAKDHAESKAWLKKAIARNEQPDITYSAKEHLAAMEKAEALRNDGTSDQDTASATRALAQAIEKLSAFRDTDFMPIPEPTLRSRPRTTNCSFTKQASHPYGGSSGVTMNCLQD